MLGWCALTPQHSPQSLASTQRYALHDCFQLKKCMEKVTVLFFLLRIDVCTTVLLCLYSCWETFIKQFEATKQTIDIAICALFFF